MLYSHAQISSTWFLVTSSITVPICENEINDYVLFQIKNLQEQVLSLKRAGIETPQTITADLEELRSM